MLVACYHPLPLEHREVFCSRELGVGLHSSVSLLKGPFHAPSLDIGGNLGGHDFPSGIDTLPLKLPLHKVEVLTHEVGKRKWLAVVGVLAKSPPQALSKTA